MNEKNCKIQHEICASELNAWGRIRSLAEVDHCRSCNLYKIVLHKNGYYQVISTPLTVGVSHD